MTLKIEKILCSVDSNSNNTLTLMTTRSIAELYCAKVYVCYYIPELELNNIEKTLRKLRAITTEVFESEKRGGGKIEFESFVIGPEDAAIEISKKSARLHTGLIIANSTPQLSLRGFDSVNENICRIAPCPVLLVRKKERARKSHRIRKILAAHDFSDHSELALQYACILAKNFNAQLNILHVIPTSADNKYEKNWSVDFFNNLYLKTNERLATAVSPSQVNGIPEICNHVRWGKPYHEILNFSKKNDSDLITMGAHGTDFGSGSLFGSNVDRVIRQSPCNILVASPLKFPSTTSGQSENKKTLDLIL